MKRCIVPLTLLLVLAAGALAQETETEAPPAPITQVPYRPVLMFLPVHVEFGKANLINRDTGVSQKGTFWGAGIGILAGYPGAFKWQIGISFERLPADNLKISSVSGVSNLDVQVGVRYFPSLPTIGLGRIPVRLTASVMAGARMISAGSWTPLLVPTATLTAGLAFFHEDSPWGPVIEFIYRPVKNRVTLTGVSNLLQTGLTLEPSWAVRFTWFFSGPSKEE